MFLSQMEYISITAAMLNKAEAYDSVRTCESGIWTKVEHFQKITICNWPKFRN